MGRAREIKREEADLGGDRVRDRKSEKESLGSERGLQPERERENVERSSFRSIWEAGTSDLGWVNPLSLDSWASHGDKSHFGP